VFPWRDRVAWSVSHGWGGSPTWYLTEYVLGVRQVGPMEWEVQPAFAGVGSALGAMPLLDGGMVDVAWEGGDCGLRTVAIDAPADSHGRLVIGLVDETTVIEIDGALIYEDGKAQVPGVTVESGAVVVDLSSPTANVTISSVCPE
jgi:alpha-L-rhamnosidase